MEKITTAEQAAKVFNEHRYANIGGWVADADGAYVHYGWSCFRTVAACAIANHLSGYYAALEAEQLKRACTWTCDADGLWSSTCGLIEWSFNAGGPVENQMKFCCGCGGALSEAQKEQENG